MTVGPDLRPAGGHENVADLPWALAAQPAERLAPGLPAAVDADRARRRLESWFELAALRDGGDVDTTLAPTGTTEAELRGLLGETGEALTARLTEVPDWAGRFAHTWAHHRAADPDPADGELGLLEIARPALDSAVHHMVRTIEPLLAGQPGLAGIAEALARTVPVNELNQAMSRTMVLELNVARVRGQLDGETGAQRYRGYVRRLRDPATALAVWHEYPVLARIVDDTLTAWSNSCARLTERLVADLADIRANLWYGADPGLPTEVSFGAGDRHKGGQTVAIVGFEHAKVVYKPRSLAVDAAFQRYVDWFNGGDTPHRLKIAKPLLRDDYGWCEFIDGALECASTEEISAFYWRLGAELALLHSLRASDFHFENLIASGPHPVLIDLEALFDTSRTTVADTPEDEPDPATVAYQDSVMSVGLLPAGSVVRNREDDSTFRFDVSGIGAAGSQRSLIPVATVDLAGTDEMHVVAKHVDVEARHNRPRHDGAAVTDVLAYRDEIVDGFRHTYQRIAADAEVLLAPGGVVDGFRHTPVRLVMRATFKYARLLQDSMHPDFLRDAMDRECCLAQLCGGWTGVPNRATGIAKEINALRRGDIPFFEFVPGSTDAFCDDGTVLPGMFDEPPLTAVRERIGRMGPDDLRTQLAAIASAFSAMAVGDEGWFGYAAPRAETPVDAERLRASALAVGRELAASAVTDGKRVGWFGLSLVDETFWQFIPASLDLFSGISGIGHFLSALGAHTGDACMLDLADRVFAESVLRAKGSLRATAKLVASASEVDLSGQVGAFGMWGGLLYYWAHAASAQQRTDHLELVPEVVGLIADQLAHDRTLDVISGLPGAIFSLLAIDRVTRGTGALAAARAAGDLLVDKQLRIGNGRAWPSLFNKDTPLAGFSHGASGVASALARLHAVAPDPEYLDAIVGAVRYENTLFDVAERNWRDVRDINDGTFMLGWCHGAPGIGLARYDLMRHEFLAPHRESLAEDLAVAVEGTVAGGLDSDPVVGVLNHSICHGDLGNIELLAAVAGSAPRFPDDVAVRTILGSLVEHADRDRWRSGVPHGTATPGLMPGLAGIGYNLLRFADPENVPSVLLLDAPVAGRDR